MTQLQEISTSARDVNITMTSRVRGTPEDFTRAVLDELEGRSQWWKPYVLLRHRPATPHEQPGCVVDVVANPSGHTERLLGTTRWGLRLDSLEPGSLLMWSLVDGHYRGWMEWALSAAQPEATRVSVRGWLSPHGWNRVRALAHDEIFDMTRLLRRGFDGVGRYLATVAPPEPQDDDDSAANDPDDDADDYLVTRGRSTPRGGRQ